MGKTPKTLENKGFFVHRHSVNFTELFNRSWGKKF